MNLFLSPHNDDEALFGAYSCLRYKPLVLVCLRSGVEESWNPPVHYETRELESWASCAVLGCEYKQLLHDERHPDWNALRYDLGYFDPALVFAPLPEPLAGHPHHDAIGRMAGELWPDRVRYYATYTSNGKTTRGDIVQPEPGWEELKRDALACYTSQRTHPNTQAAFNSWPLDEYLT